MRINIWSGLFLTAIYNFVIFYTILASCFLQCSSRRPFKPREGSLPFITYFLSRYRGKCVGTLVSRTAVITAGVCVLNPISTVKDTRPINVITGTSYRHQRRGVRVQVTKILVPKLWNTSTNKGYLAQKSPVILLLKRKVPDILVEIPLRPIKIDYKGEEVLSLQEECLIAGWHFFFKGDKVYSPQKFLLQKYMRVQFMNIVKKKLWCETLSMKFQKALTNLGFYQNYDTRACLCIRDPDKSAQPCHGMYGAPLICRGKAVGMLMAPDAQWTNCTGFSNLVHLFSGTHLTNFMACVSKLFSEESKVDWKSMKKALYGDINEESYDYVPELYDKLESGSSSDEFE